MIMAVLTNTNDLSTDSVRARLNQQKSEGTKVTSARADATSVFSSNRIYYEDTDYVILHFAKHSLFKAWDALKMPAEIITFLQYSVNSLYYNATHCGYKWSPFTAESCVTVDKLTWFFILMTDVVQSDAYYLYVVTMDSIGQHHSLSNSCFILYALSDPPVVSLKK